MRIEEHVRIFHDYANECPGIIVSDPERPHVLRCAECGARVGQLDLGALEQLIELAEKGGAR